MPGLGGFQTNPQPRDWKAGQTNGSTSLRSVATTDGADTYSVLGMLKILLLDSSKLIQRSHEHSHPYFHVLLPV